MSRRRAREKALCVLFQVDVGQIPWQTALERAIAEEDMSVKARDFLKRLVEGTLENLIRIDELISHAALDWTLERMAGTDRNILRFSVYELLECSDIPVSVTVNEAVELAKVYGDDESGKFVNGVLGRIARDTDPKKEAQDGKCPGL
ncbi:MAG: transcription antitermination factor NusB [Bacillota bacterium]